jgi:hypothetical protein
LWNAFHTQLEPKLGEQTMISIADSFRQEGIEQNKLDMAKRLLQEKVDFAFIARITDLPVDKIKQVQQQSSRSCADVN